MTCVPLATNLLGGVAFTSLTSPFFTIAHAEPTASWPLCEGQKPAKQRCPLWIKLVMSATTKHGPNETLNSDSPSAGLWTTLHMF